MGIWLELIEICSKLLSQGLGIYNLELGESLFYNLLFIFVIGWMSLLGFILIKKTKLLKHWKIPNFVNLSIIILISLIGFGVSYLILTNLVLFSLLDKNTIYTPVSFLNTLLFMIIYISFGLELINQKTKKKEKEELEIPSELKIFIPRSILLGFGLILTFLAQLFLLKYLDKLPFELILPFVTPWKYIAAFFLLTLLGSIFIIVAITSNNKLLIFTKKFEKFIQKHPKGFLFSLSILMFFFLVLPPIIEKNWSDVVHFSVLVIILFLVGLFFQKIEKIILFIKKKLKEGNNLETKIKLEKK